MQLFRSKRSVGLRRFGTATRVDHTYLDRLLHAYDRGVMPDAALAPLEKRSLASLPRQDVARGLVAAAYFDAWPKESYEEVLGYLNRTNETDEKSARELVDLKKFELMVRCGMIPQLTFDTLSTFSRKYLIQIRSSPPVPVEAGPFELDVYGILKEISIEFQDDFHVGPYSLALARVSEIGVTERPRTNHEKSLRSIKTSTCVNSLGPNSFVDGRTLLPEAKIKRALLGKLGFRSVWIPYTEWESLLSDNAKRLYLHSLVSSVS